MPHFVRLLVNPNQQLRYLLGLSDDPVYAEFPLKPSAIDRQSMVDRDVIRHAVDQHA